MLTKKFLSVLSKINLICESGKTLDNYTMVRKYLVDP